MELSNKFLTVSQQVWKWLKSIDDEDYPYYFSILVLFAFWIAVLIIEVTV